MSCTIEIDTPVIPRVWSPLQIAIFDEIQSGTDNLIIEACAGGAKTSTIVAALDRLPKGKRAIFLAFNKSIADSLRNKVPSTVDVATLHSLAYSVLKTAGFAHVEIRKTYNILRYKILDEEVDKETESWFYENVSIFCSTISKAKGLARVLSDSEILERALEDGAIDSALTRELLPLLYKKSLEFEPGAKGMCNIDFDDMLRLPVVRAMNFPKYDYVFVDEVQDLNQIQREIVARIIATNGRLIAVGDRHQAIYAFRGADSDSMDLLANGFDCKSMPLDVSYRCSHAVVAEARKLYKCIHACEFATVGSVSTVTMINVTKMIAPGSLILCRVNAPLIGMALSLYRTGKAVELIGSDFAKLIVSYANKAAPNGTLTTSSINVCFTKLIGEAKSQTRIALLNDIAATLNEFVNRGIDRPIAIRNALTDLCVGGQHDPIRLSSIHKAKGLEADDVYLLSPELLPHPMADDLVQETNLHYVAVTRAKHNFYYVK